MYLQSKKGHNLCLDANPSEHLEVINSSKYIKLHPCDFLGIKPKLLISEGESVKQGQPIYFDKKQPEVMFVTNVSGLVRKIVYGDRRTIASIDIQIKESKEEVTFS